MSDWRELEASSVPSVWRENSFLHGTPRVRGSGLGPCFSFLWSIQSRYSCLPCNSFDGGDCCCSPKSAHVNFPEASARQRNGDHVSRPLRRSCPDVSRRCFRRKGICFLLLSAGLFFFLSTGRLFCCCKNNAAGCCTGTVGNRFARGRTLTVNKFAHEL